MEGWIKSHFLTKIFISTSSGYVFHFHKSYTPDNFSRTDLEFPVCSSHFMAYSKALNERGGDAVPTLIAAT